MPTRIAERELALEAADDVGQDLRRAVTVFFRKLLTYRYDTESELAQSPLWQELPDIFRRHCDLYTDLAIVNLSLDRRGCLNWVKKEIEADHDAIMIQHFGCGADGSLRSESDSVTSGRESWRAMHHFGFWNWNSVIGAFARELTHARSNAVRAAKIRIFSHSDANRGRTRTGTAVTSMTEEPAFYSLLEDFRSIHWNEKEYRLTLQQAGILRLLYEARKRGAREVSGDDIRKKVGCGRIHDSFRSGDGPRLWNRLVVPVTGTKGMYRLNLPDPK